MIYNNQKYIFELIEHNMLAFKVDQPGWVCNKCSCLNGKKKKKRIVIQSSAAGMKLIVI